MAGSMISQMNAAGHREMEGSIWIGSRDKVSPGPDDVDHMWEMMAELG